MGAAVQGQAGGHPVAAVGMGAELATQCDVRVASISHDQTSRPS